MCLNIWTKKELIDLVQLRHLRELGLVPVSRGKAQPGPGEATLGCFYLTFSSPRCWVLSKHQAHISLRFHSPPSTLAVSSGLTRLRFNSIKTLPITINHYSIFHIRGFGLPEDAHVCLWNLGQAASKLCSNPDWDNNNNIPGHRHVEDKLPEANETSHLNARQVRYIILKKKHKHIDLKIPGVG